MKIDLHMHSKFSDDGELSVEEILELAKKNSVSEIAITDHNSVKGVEQAINYGKKIGVKVFSGVELDCTHMGINLHLLGYGFDYKNPVFEKIEQDIFDQEIIAAKEKIKKIRENTDFKINEAEIFKMADGKIVTGEIIGEHILENPENKNNKLAQPYLNSGEKNDMPFVHFYWDFFSQGKVAYVPINFLSLHEAIKILKNAGGITVLAHPANNLKANTDFIHEILKENIDGIEVYSSYHKHSDIEFYEKIAKEKNLLITCGTDFHGKNKPKIHLGEFNNKINFENISKKLNLLLEKNI
ncbi:MAG: PHP domain-containing protein [Fusobacteriaceae bacterium]